MNCFHFEFGSETSAAEISENSLSIRVAAPILGNSNKFSAPLPPGKTSVTDDVVIHDSGDLVLGFLRASPDQEIERATHTLYHRIFEAVGPRHLYRIWHFIPRINRVESGLENYQLFCRGRSEAFQRAFGETSCEKMPAASAVGSIGIESTFLFIAGKNAPRHFENPEQIPAYRYPRSYGPKSPSFARATRVSIFDRNIVFVSGTASIKGSESVFPGDLLNQLATTLDNLLLIGKTSGLGDDFAREQPHQRRFIVYLRHPEDYPAAKSFLQKRLLQPSDQCLFLQADICRAELLVEIEATIFIPG